MVLEVLLWLNLLGCASSNRLENPGAAAGAQEVDWLLRPGIGGVEKKVPDVLSHFLMKPVESDIKTFAVWPSGAL